jgi:hypothetical protein
MDDLSSGVKKRAFRCFPALEGGGEIFVFADSRAPVEVAQCLSPVLELTAADRQWVLGYRITLRQRDDLDCPMDELRAYEQLVKNFRISRVGDFFHLRLNVPTQSKLDGRVFALLYPVVNFVDKSQADLVNDQYHMYLEKIPDPRIAFVLPVAEAPPRMRNIRVSRFLTRGSTPVTAVLSSPFDAEKDHLDERGVHFEVFASNMLPIEKAANFRPILVLRSPDGPTAYGFVRRAHPFSQGLAQSFRNVAEFDNVVTEIIGKAFDFDHNEPRDRAVYRARRQLMDIDPLVFCILKPGRGLEWVESEEDLVFCFDNELVIRSINNLNKYFFFVESPSDFKRQTHCSCPRSTDYEESTPWPQGSGPQLHNIAIRVGREKSFPWPQGSELDLVK